MGTRIWAFAPLDWKTGGAVALAFLALAACDGAPSAVPARAHAANGADRRLADAAPDGDSRPAARDAGYRSSGGAQDEAAETPLYHGKPIWTASKRHSAKEQADYHFQRDGEALGAKNVDDFVAKAHAFVDAPPKGAQTLTRANGDRLIYDAKANIFAVADKDGVPRTLFQPRDGGAYWDKQKESVAKGEDFATERRSSSRRSSDGDNG
jgi:pyocin large subunit-like protein